MAHLKGVETDPAHEGNLVGEHVANGAQFAAKAELLAHQPRRGEGAPIGEFREIKGNEGKARQVGGDVVEAGACLQVEANWCGRGQELSPLAEPAHLVEDHGAGPKLPAVRCRLKGVAPEGSRLKNRTVGIGRPGQALPVDVGRSAGGAIRRGGRAGHRYGRPLKRWHKSPLCWRKWPL